jgi:hypothetical protein
MPIHQPPGAALPGAAPLPGKPAGGGDFVKAQIQPVVDWIVANLSVVVLLAVIGLGVWLAIWLLIAWLRGRGQFMFLDGVAHNRATIGWSWHEYAREGNALFGFFFGFGAAITLAVVLILVVAAAIAWPDLRAGQFGGRAITAVILGPLSLVLLAVFAGVVSLFLHDFVVPIMFLRRNGLAAAWREFTGQLLPGRLPMFVLYILFRIVIAIVLGALTIGLTCATCCIALIPYVGTVILLPLSVFSRSYSLFFLEQFGPDWQVIARAVKPKDLRFDELPPA